jgi:hypothetical protein
VRSRKSGAFGFEALGINFAERHETIAERWGRWQQRRDPLAYQKWRKYKRTREYQARPPQPAARPAPPQARAAAAARSVPSAARLARRPPGRAGASLTGGRAQYIATIWGS